MVCAPRLGEVPAYFGMCEGGCWCTPSLISASEGLLKGIPETL